MIGKLQKWLSAKQKVKLLTVLSKMSAVRAEILQSLRSFRMTRKNQGISFFVILERASPTPVVLSRFCEGPHKQLVCSLMLLMLTKCLLLRQRLFASLRVTKDEILQSLCSFRMPKKMQNGSIFVILERALASEGFRFSLV